MSCGRFPGERRRRRLPSAGIATTQSLGTPISRSSTSSSRETHRRSQSGFTRGGPYGGRAGGCLHLCLAPARQRRQQKSACCPRRPSPSPHGAPPAVRVRLKSEPSQGGVSGSSPQALPNTRSIRPSSRAAFEGDEQRHVSQAEGHFRASLLSADHPPAKKGIQ